MLLEIAMIILGFILLICGANLLIKGSVNLAKKFHIPEILIGLTIVALRNFCARINCNNNVSKQRSRRFNFRKCHWK